MNGKVKLIIGALGILTNVSSVVATYKVQDSNYGLVVKDLSKENQSKENTISELSRRISYQNSEINKSKLEINSITENYNNLLEKYQILNEKYIKCISTDGVINTVGTIDMRSFESGFKTGDNIEFKLTSASLFVSIIRVSKEGPVILITGCENYITENEIKIKDNNKTYFVLRPNNPLIIRFTSQSCEDNENIEPAIAEEIILSVKDYDVDNQHFNLNYLRKFLL